MLSTTRLQLDIVLTEEGRNFAGNHYLLAEDISRFFQPKSYLENGYFQAVSIKEDGLVIDPKAPTDQDIVFLKLISQTKVNFYKFEWLDTSAISIIDFGEEFTFYQVEESIK